MDSPHFITLLEYNYWANQQILQGLQTLTPEQLHAPVAISHGNAYELIRHMLDVEWSWRLFASGGAAQKFLWEVEDLPDFNALANYWPIEYARQLEFVKGLSEADLEKSIDYGTPQGGSPHFMKVWQILIHINIHATNHRSELSRYLETCGHPLPQELDFAAHVTEVPPAPPNPE